MACKAFENLMWKHQHINSIFKFCLDLQPPDIMLWHGTLTAFHLISCYLTGVWGRCHLECMSKIFENFLCSFIFKVHITNVNKKDSIISLINYGRKQNCNIQIPVLQALDQLTITLSVKCQIMHKPMCVYIPVKFYLQKLARAKFGWWSIVCQLSA